MFVECAVAVTGQIRMGKGWRTFRKSTVTFDNLTTNLVLECAVVESELADPANAPPRREMHLDSKVPVVNMAVAFNLELQVRPFPKDGDSS